jgi:IPT/TIG domain-containing protein
MQDARTWAIGLTLVGEGHAFGDGEPVVTLNGTPLTVVTASASEIVATLPPGLDPGTYLLTVSRGPATTQFDGFNLTLGAVGPQGPAGPTGPPGAPGTFTGRFQSPNGAYSLDVTDTGIRLRGPGATIEIVNSAVNIMSGNVTVRSDVNTDIRSGANTTVRAGASMDIQSSATTTLRAGAITTIQSGGITDIQGGVILLNGPGRPAARAADPVQVDPATGTGAITSGSTSVFIGD